MLLLVGCILEPLPAMIIFVPTLLPLGAQLGIDPIQFGSVIVLNLMIGLLHPPIGLLLFVVSNVGRIPLKPVIVDSLPFLALVDHRAVPRHSVPADHDVAARARFA